MCLHYFVGLPEHKHHLLSEQQHKLLRILSLLRIMPKLMPRDLALYVSMV